MKPPILALALVSMLAPAVPTPAGPASAGPASADDQRPEAHRPGGLLAEQLLRRIELTFTYVDTDHNGKLSAREADLLGVEPRERTSWDQDRDGGLTFRELLEGGMIPAGVERLRRLAASAIADADRDDDHALSLSEFMASRLSFHRHTPRITPQGDDAFKLGAFERTVGSGGKLSQADLEWLFGDALDRGYSVSDVPTRPK